MPILDLVTPWAAAARSGSADDLAAFLRRSADLLEPIRRQRAPTELALPSPSDWDDLITVAADESLHQHLREVRDRLVDRGLTAPQRMVLMASAAPGGAFEVIPEPGATTIAIFVDRLVGATHASPVRTPPSGLSKPIPLDAGVAGPHAARLRAAIACAMAALTRWTSPGNPVAAIAARGNWDRWAAAREIPLAEWIYAAGLGLHAAQLLGVTQADALGLSDGELHRIRLAERLLQEHLDADLDHAGMGLVLRWLEDDAPVTMRRAADGTLIPKGAGRYLGWRMLAGRVERVGLAEAARMDA